jgi:hypothetical protein
LSFDVAVVIEKVDLNNEVKCGYTWTPMSEWSTYADTREYNAKEEETAKRRRQANENTIRTSAISIASLKVPYGNEVEALYEALCNVQYTRKTISDDRIISRGEEFEEALYACEDYILEYESRFENCYLVAEQSKFVLHKLFGFI